jgi:hypothetical protein
MEVLALDRVMPLNELIGRAREDRLDDGIDPLEPELLVVLADGMGLVRTFALEARLRALDGAQRGIAERSLRLLDAVGVEERTSPGSVEGDGLGSHLSSPP